MSKNQTNELNPKPVGGWILVYLICLLISEAFYISGFKSVVLSNLLDLIETNNWIQNVIVLGTFIKMLTTGLILILFISKKKYAPKLIITFEAFCILVRILTYVDFIIRGQIIPKSYNVSILIGLISLIWILYFLKSKRVKETFIND